MELWIPITIAAAFLSKSALGMAEAFERAPVVGGGRRTCGFYTPGPLRCFMCGACTTLVTLALPTPNGTFLLVLLVGWSVADYFQHGCLCGCFHFGILPSARHFQKPKPCKSPCWALYCWVTPLTTGAVLAIAISVVGVMVMCGRTKSFKAVQLTQSAFHTKRRR